jgi:hypothetical protein
MKAMIDEVCRDFDLKQRAAEVAPTLEEEIAAAVPPAADRPRQDAPSVVRPVAAPPPSILPEPPAEAALPMFGAVGRKSRFSFF